MDQLFIILQHLLPQHLLSRLTGWLATLGNQLDQGAFHPPVRQPL